MGKKKISRKELSRLRSMASNRKGQRNSPLHCARISSANIGRIPSYGFRGWRHSKSSRRKISKALIGLPSWNKGKKLSEEHCRNLSISHKGYRYSEERKRKQSRMAKKNKKILASLVKAQTAARLATSPNKLEKAFSGLLDRLKISYVFEPKIGIYWPDFLIKGTKLIFEVDGDYWHSSSGVKAKDRRKIKALKELGYKVVRFSEKLIRRSPEIVSNLIEIYIRFES